MKQEEFFTRYKFDRTKDLIGGGGFGNVYKVFDSVESELIALKISEVKTGQESVSLQKEVELASSLSRHVNIARYSACYRFELPFGVFDFGILQYYPLGNLSHLVKSKKLTLEEKEQIAKGVILGIQHLHKNNIVHRDLKSANILIAGGYKNEYVPKIADFGLSKQFTEHNQSYFSNSFAGGSLHYVAPEQLEGSDLRKNVDLWSLGVVLFELFSGLVPFNSNVHDGSETARSEIIKKIRSASLPDEIRIIPEPWLDIVKICLIADPAKRVKSIEEVMKVAGKEVSDPLNTLIDQKEDQSERKFKVSNISTPAHLYYLLVSLGLLLTIIFIVRNCSSTTGEIITLYQDESELYGYKSLEGNIIIPAKYNKASVFKNGRAQVEVEDSVYFIDASGAIVELINPDSKESKLENNQLAQDNQKLSESSFKVQQTETQKGKNSEKEQDNNYETKSQPVKDSSNPVESDEIFTRVEQMPIFRGGEKDLLDYLSENITYPTLARENGITGIVIIQFVVEKDGSIFNPEVARGIGGGCDEEALRVVKGMPNWKPGKLQGKLVRVKYTLPIKFRLE